MGSIISQKWFEMILQKRKKTPKNNQITSEVIILCTAAALKFHCKDI
jgi:hypothetical protein